MSSYSRMIVIPQEEYAQMTAVQQVRQPLTQQFYNMEQDYQKNLHVKDPHRSLLLQSETIERMKGLKDQMRSYLTLSTPKPYRTRAESLFQSIEPYLNVNEKGEIIKDDNSVIESSRYEDLIQHAVRDRRRNFTPTGWSYFIELLRKHNVPKSSLNRETLDELFRNVMKPPQINAKVEKFIKRQRVGKRKADPLPLEFIVKGKRQRIPSKRYPPSEFLLNY